MKKNFAKAVLFAAIFVVALYAVTKIFTAKFTDNNCQSYTAAQLYELDKNSVEVVLGGSSQAVFCVNAMELYDKYGISAYGTGSPNQPTLVSLGWLREMNKTQNIKVAVLDTSQLFEEVDESFYRQTLDTMHFSANKLDILRQHIAESDTADDLLSYLFPIIKYHDRWESLEEQDFTFSTANSPMYMGTRMADYVYSFDNYEDLMDDEEIAGESLDMIDYQKSGLEKYAAYCKENGIELLLIKTPKEDWTETKDKKTQQLADELGVTYINYASKEWGEKLGLNYYSDFKDPQHLNVRGADKVADALGKYLSEHYDLTDFRETSPKSEEYMDTYHAKRTEAYFLTNSDVVEYLKELKENYIDQGDYDVLFELTDDKICSVWTEEMQKALESCGIQTDIRTLKSTAYTGSIVGGKVKETTGNETEMQVTGKFGNGFPFVCTSIPSGNSASRATFIINGVRKYSSTKGLNIFLYNHTTGEILDTPTVAVCTDGKLRLNRPEEDKHQ